MLLGERQLGHEYNGAALDKLDRFVFIAKSKHIKSPYWFAGMNTQE